MSSVPPMPRPPAAPSLEKISKIWIAIPEDLSFATSAELQELNESCCFCLEQVCHTFSFFIASALKIMPFVLNQVSHKIYI